MLNGLYGYIFGGEIVDSNAAAQEVQSNGSDSAKKLAKGKSADGEASEWILVGEEAVHKASAEAGPHLLDECKSLSSSAPSMTTSWCSEASTATAIATSKEEKRAAELQQKRMENAVLQQQRQWLAKMMFSDPDTRKPLQSPTDNNFEPCAATNNPSSARLKRACKAELVHSQAKTKPRSKKSAGAKFNANRNNDRKCNPHNPMD